MGAMLENEGNMRLSRATPAWQAAASTRNRRGLTMSERLQIGILVFPRVTQLDFTGPLQVFSSVPGAEVHLIWKRIEPVRSDRQ